MGVKWLTTYLESSLGTASEFVPLDGLLSTVYKLGRSAPSWGVSPNCHFGWSSCCSTGKWRVSAPCASWSGREDCMTSWTRSRTLGTCTWRTASTATSSGSWSWSSHASLRGCPRSASMYLPVAEKPTDLALQYAVLPEEDLFPIWISFKSVFQWYLSDWRRYSTLLASSQNFRSNFGCGVCAIILPGPIAFPKILICQHLEWRKAVLSVNSLLKSRTKGG